MRWNCATLLTALLVAPAPVGGAEGAGWPVFRGDRNLRGVAPGALPAHPEVLWSTPTGAAIVSSPVVEGGKVYFGSDDGQLYCLRVADGEKLWSFATEDMIEAPPLICGETVYFGSSDFFFYALDAASGELRWKHEVDDKILGGANFLRNPAGDGDWIVVGCYDNYLYCFNEAGDVVWKYLTDNYVNGTPAVDGRFIVFGGCDAVLHVVDGHTGEAAYKVELGEACHVAGSAGVQEGKAYFGHYGNEFVCVDWKAARAEWRYASPRFAFFSSPAIGADRVVFGGRDKKLHCAALADGKPLWTFATLRKVDSSPVICGDGVVFASGDGRVHCLALADGSERWMVEIGSAIYSSPAVADGVILVGCEDGSLYALGERKS